MKYIHFVRAFVFAVTVALALGATMHGALADQVRIYVDFNGGPEPMSGRPIGILVDSAKWTTTKTDIPASWNRVSNISSDSIGSQTGGAGAGKVDSTQPVILVGNFGDGRINVFTESGIFLGQLQSHKQVITIDGLWALGFAPTTATTINPDWLFFTAGPAKEMDGVFGYLSKQ